MENRWQSSCACTQYDCAELASQQSDHRPFIASTRARPGNGGEKRAAHTESLSAQRSALVEQRRRSATMTLLGTLHGHEPSSTWMRNRCTFIYKQNASNLACGRLTWREVAAQTRAQYPCTTPRSFFAWRCRGATPGAIPTTHIATCLCSSEATSWCSYFLARSNGDCRNCTDGAKLGYVY